MRWHKEQGDHHSGSEEQCHAHEKDSIPHCEDFSLTLREMGDGSELEQTRADLLCLKGSMLLLLREATAGVWG